MKSLAKFFLIGMPGSGKSTLGKKVAAELDLNYYDLDALIESKEERSISEIFEVEGERYFRECERSLLREVVSKQENYVVATGGGTPCFYDNLYQMNTSGVSIFLDPPFETLIKRLLNTNINTRPKLKDLDLEKTLKETYSARKPFYTQAKFSISSSKNEENELKQVLKSFI